MANDHDTRGCYVYGIVRDDARPPLAGLRGVGDAVVDFVRGDRLAAVVGDVAQRDLTPPDTGTDADGAAWLESVVRAHESVVERCLTAGTVLPMRFATTFRGADDVRTLLVEHEAGFSEALARLEGRREWGLKAELDVGTNADWVRTARPDLAEQERRLDERPPGAAYFERKRLEQRLAAHADDAVTASLQAAHVRLSAVAADALLLPHGGAASGAQRESIVLNAAYLVPEALEPELHRLVESLRHEHAAIGIRYRVTGPWPPYNFVSELRRDDA